MEVYTDKCTRGHVEIAFDALLELAHSNSGSSDVSKRFLLNIWNESNAFNMHDLSFFDAVNFNHAKIITIFMFENNYKHLTDDFMFASELRQLAEARV